MPSLPAVKQEIKPKILRPAENMGALSQHRWRMGVERGLGMKYRSLVGVAGVLIHIAAEVVAKYF